jgi:hypothetical protein
MKKDRKDPAERRRRMDRCARLQDAPTWLPAQPGMDSVEAYERWYGVDRLCAIIELRRLGGPISEEYEAQARDAVIQRAKAGSTERAAKRAEKQRAKQQRAAEKQRAKQQRAAAKRAEKQRVKSPIARARSSEAADAREWTSWADAGIDAECAAMADDVPGRCGGYAGRSIEDALLEAARAVDPRVVETTIETEVETRTTIETEIEITTKTRTEIETKTKVETRTEIKTESELERLEGGRVRVRIALEADPEVLARHAWGLIFAISARSFADADADVDSTDYHEWSADDMLRCLAFDRGRLCFAADDVHGRCMQTTIEIDGAGKITLETVDRGEAAMRWIAKLQRKPAPLIEDYLGDGDDGAALEPIPF